MDEVKEEFKKLEDVEDEKRQKFIYEVHKSANSNCLNNPLSLAVAASVCYDTGVKFIKDINNCAHHRITILMDMNDRFLNALILGKKIAKEAYKAVLNFINCEKDRNYIRLFDINVNYDLSNAIVYVDIDYVRDLKDE